MTLFTVLFLIFLTLKVAGLVTWSWVVIASPLVIHFLILAYLHFELKRDKAAIQAEVDALLKQYGDAVEEENRRKTEEDKH